MKNPPWPGVVDRLFNIGALLVGSRAEAMVHDEPIAADSDWDIMVPPEHWSLAAALFPVGSRVNSHGGVRFAVGNSHTDVWPCSLQDYLRRPMTAQREFYAVDIKHSRVYRGAALRHYGATEQRMSNKRTTLDMDVTESYTLTDGGASVSYSRRRRISMVIDGPAAPETPQAPTTSPSSRDDYATLRTLMGYQALQNSRINSLVH